MKTAALVLTLVFGLGLAGCSALPVAMPEPEASTRTPDTDLPQVAAPLPQSAPGQSSPAAEALLGEARALRADGQFELAAVRLERALRIEPRGAELWLELARVRYDTGDFAATVQFAERARRFAGNDADLARAAEQLALAARARGS